jgi:arsenic resistance protein ArsH
VLFGSCRTVSRSRLLALEARNSLLQCGADVAVFDPCGLPLDGNECKNHPKLAELHRLVSWSDGQVWCSPEHHSTMSGVMKLALDCFPCDQKGRSLARGKVLSVMQVAGGPMSGNAVQDMQRAGRSMGMYLASHQVSVGEAGRQFGADGRLVRPELQTRLEDAMSELVGLALLFRENAGWLADGLRDARRTEPSIALAASG